MLPHEYLYLAASTYDRQALINEKSIIKNAFSLEKERSGTFILENITTSPDPDKRLERIFTFNINSSNVFYIDTHKRPELFERNTKKADGIEGFGCLLHDKKLIKKVRDTLNYANSLKTSNYLVGEFLEYFDYTPVKISPQKRRQSSFSILPYTPLTSKRPISAKSIPHLIPNESEQRKFLQNLTEKDMNSYIPSYMLFPVKNARNSSARRQKTDNKNDKNDIMVRPYSAKSFKNSEITCTTLPQTRPTTAKTHVYRPITAKTQISRPSTAKTLLLTKQLNTFKNSSSSLCDETLEKESFIIKKDQKFRILKPKRWKL